MFYIETDRLKLIPLGLRHLLLWQLDRIELEKSLGLEISAMIIAPQFQKEIEEALPFWIESVRENQAKYPWFTNWEIVLKQDNLSIGGISLMGLPDHNGEVMTGYYMDANYHNYGFATEALGGLLRWVFRNPDVKRVAAETPKDNHASQRVLIKNGFLKTEIKHDYYVWEREPERIMSFKRKQAEKVAV